MLAFELGILAGINNYASLEKEGGILSRAALPLILAGTGTYGLMQPEYSAELPQGVTAHYPSWLSRKLSGVSSEENALMQNRLSPSILAGEVMNAPRRLNSNIDVYLGGQGRDPATIPNVVANRIGNMFGQNLASYSPLTHSAFIPAGIVGDRFAPEVATQAFNHEVLGHGSQPGILGSVLLRRGLDELGAERIAAYMDATGGRRVDPAGAYVKTYYPFDKRTDLDFNEEIVTGNRLGMDYPNLPEIPAKINKAIMQRNKRGLNYAINLVQPKEDPWAFKRIMRRKPENRQDALVNAVRERQWGKLPNFLSDEAKDIISKHMVPSKILPTPLFTNKHEYYTKPLNYHWADTWPSRYFTDPEPYFTDPAKTMRRQYAEDLQKVRNLQPIYGKDYKLKSLFFKPAEPTWGVDEPGVKPKVNQPTQFSVSKGMSSVPVAPGTKMPNVEAIRPPKRFAMPKFKIR